MSRDRAHCAALGREGSGMTHRMAVMASTVALVAAVATASSNEFISTWKSPTAGTLNFVGRKVGAVVIVDDLSLQMSAEEALAREITARGPIGVASHRIVPREELANKDRAKGWFERAGVQGLVIMRLVDTDREKVYSSVIWSSGYYANAWDYYGTGWATAYPIGKGHIQTTITVETLLYDLANASPIWAGVSRTVNPKDTGSFMKEMAKDVVQQLKKAGLTK
jgi:hypothetical protein